MAVQADVEGASVDPKTGETVHTEGRSDSEISTKAYATLKAIVDEVEGLLTKARDSLDAMDRDQADAQEGAGYGAAARNAKAK